MLSMIRKVWLLERDAKSERRIANCGSNEKGLA